MDNVPGVETPSQTPKSYAPEPLRFTGSGSDYFGIWIVNLLLTIVTLGIYSAWAKVRRLQYFYRHTELAGSSFDFHGIPLKIFIGRLIALAMLLAYNFSVRLHSPFTIPVIVVLVIVMPWLLRNSFRFRLYNTSWRGTRFHFRGSLGGSYRAFLLNGFLTAITLYVMAPFMHQRLKAYQHDNSWFGRSKFSFHATVGNFYLIYLILLAGLVGAAVLFVVGGFGTAITGAFRAPAGGGPIDPRAAIRAVLVLYALLLVLALSIGPVFHALITNLIWNNTRLGEHRFECKMSPLKLIWIALSNLVLVVVTFGLFIPWAMVRLTRFQLECVRVLPASDLQEFEEAEPEKVGAVGEEAASAFDFDISL